MIFFASTFLSVWFSFSTEKKFVTYQFQINSHDSPDFLIETAIKFDEWILCKPLKKLAAVGASFCQVAASFVECFFLLH